MFVWISNISMILPVTASNHPHRKKKILTFVDFPLFSFCPLPLALSMGTKRVQLYLLYPLSQVFIDLENTFLSLVFSRLNIPRFPRYFSYVKCPEALNYIHGPSLNWLQYIHVTLYWGSQNWTPKSFHVRLFPS